MPRLTKAERSELGRLLSSLRKTRAGGRKPNPRPCPHCGEPYSGRAYRAHVPRCDGKPTPKTEPAVAAKKKQAARR